MDPITIAALVAAAATVGSHAFSSSREKKAGKMRAKETKRETAAEGLDQAASRKAELAASRLQSNSKLSKSKSRAMMDTAANFRGAMTNV